MKYADPTRCPQCRGPIGGVQQCTACGFDLTSDAARQLWSLFVQADTVIERTHAPSTAGVGQAPPPPPPQQSPLSPAYNSAPKRHRPAMNLTPGSVLLGLGALSLVVAATIFVSLTWGSIGILGRATILLAITFAFGAGLWLSLKRTLPATSEALSFVVLAMVSINVSAAVYEGLFGLDEIHGGYPVLIWAALVIGISYSIQPLSELEIGRTIYVVEAATGLASIPAAIALGSFVWEFQPGHEQWGMIAGLPVLALFFWFVRFTGQKIASYIVWAMVSLWVFVMTAWVWIALVDGFRELTLSLVGAGIVPALLAAAIGFAFNQTRFWSYTYAVSSVGFLFGIGLVNTLDRLASVDGTSLTLVFFSTFLVVQLLGQALIKETSTPLAWINPVPVTVLALVWLVPIAGLLLPWDAFDEPEPISTTGASLAWAAAATAFATGVLSVYLVQSSRRSYVSNLVWLKSGFLVAAAAFTSLGLAAIAQLLGSALVGSTMILIAGTAAIVWFGRTFAYWQLFGLILSLAALAISPKDSWTMLVTVLVIAVVTAASAWWIQTNSHEDKSQALGLSSIGYASIASWSTIYGFWILPHVAGARMASPYVYLGLLVAGVLIMALALKPWFELRIGVEAGAALLGLVALSSALERTQTFAIVALSLAVACAVVALADTQRRRQFLLGFAFGAAAWFAQLMTWDVETVEAYTAPVAIAVIVLGLVRMSVHPVASSTAALSGGLALAFVPSLVGVLDEPASKRALVWGGVALAVLVAGVVLRWLAPLLAGAAALIIVILANVGPLIMDLDRWIVFGILGAVLLAIGIRWEQNVVDGKALLMKLAHLR